VLKNVRPLWYAESIETNERGSKMGYFKIIDINENGVSRIDSSELSFGDAIEIELALATPNAVQIACVICFTPIPQGTGNTCTPHKGMKPNW